MIGQWTWVWLMTMTIGGTIVLIGTDFLRLAQDERKRKHHE